MSSRNSLCSSCENNSSTGELRIRDILRNLSIKHIHEKKFNDCENILKLRFDFYLPEYNTWIEYDGKHHYEPVNFGGISDKRAIEEHDKTKLRDKIKNKYCKDNNINLIRIPYWDYENIEEILLKQLNINI